MSILRVVAVVALGIVAVVSLPAVGAQAPSGTSAAVPTTVDPDAAIKAAAERMRAEAAALKNWTAPRTPWGDPDLRGVWHLATYTPLQRPPHLAGKPFYTEEEAIAAFKRAVEADAEVDPRTVHYDWKEYSMDAWQGGARPSLRTSLIVDPPDGRLPPLTEAAKQRQAARAAAAKQRNPEVGILIFGNFLSTYTRCIIGQTSVPLIQGGNPGANPEDLAASVTAEALFFQSQGYVTIVHQSNNDVRIIPLDGRPRVPSSIRQWWGDARGRWEGNTLVVETTNFKNRAPAPNMYGSSDDLRVVERFTRIAPNTLRYEYTLTDPNTWTRPWSAEANLPRVEPMVMYEFACHEQNYGVINVVRGAQVREREAAARARASR
ncbi:MAG: hypothetical protein A3I61_17115 [Acidobacteria bacterium RIFCSPLOWO2_02_FULL_68_18]|nr:MAG: hypothetical protein A3I61_17115 [Acidobacteria bacterium RIFCSPLOWO2_02_FULL_68_18]